MKLHLFLQTNVVRNEFHKHPGMFATISKMVLDVVSLRVIFIGQSLIHSKSYSKFNCENQGFPCNCYANQRHIQNPVKHLRWSFLRK